MNSKFICIHSTGPTDKTTEDFVTVWSMLWQERVEKIVMLTNLNEGGVSSRLNVY